MSDDTVWIAEGEDFDFDTDTLLLSGLFSAHLEIERGNEVASVEGLDGVTARDAVEWGRSRSDRVVIRGDGVTFSAGRERIVDLPEWSEERLGIRPLTVHVEPAQARRTDDEEVIQWDVVVAPSAPPFTDDPAFDALFRACLSEVSGDEVVETPRREGFESSVALRFSPRTVDEAREVAAQQALEAFRQAMRSLTQEPYGWVLGIDPRPATDR